MLRLLRQAWTTRRQLRRHRRIARTAPATLVEGVESRVVGLARPLGPVLEAPLTKRLCVCFAVVIYDWHHDGSVRVVHTTQGRAAFALADDTATAVVDPARAEMSALFDHETTLLPTTEHGRALLERLGIGARDWSQTRALELDEAIIELDEHIAVIGTAEREHDTDAAPASYRDGERPTRMRIYPTAISDDPRLLR